MLSCRKATFLVEKEQGGSLSFVERMQLSMHMKICDKCATYQKQSLFIDQLIKRNKNIILPKGKLTLASKAKIQGLINERLENN